MCMYPDYEYYTNGICKYNGSDILVFIDKIDNSLVSKKKHYYLASYCYAVVKGIPDHFIFHLLPALQRFIH